MAKEQAGGPASSPQDAGQMDTEFGRLAVERQLATPDEIRQCVAEKRASSHKSFSDIMVARGVLTTSQVGRIKKTIEETTRQFTGQQIPGYRILSKLGSGAMATVFKARQLSLDRVVAIKVLPRKLSESADYVERFYKEGKAAAKLNHPNIVQAFDVGEAGGYHYFVMEYVKGRTIYDDLAAGNVYSEADALRIIIQIARALEHAHGMDLIHRDVKPKNIMLTGDGLAKLADMGLARVISDEQTAQAEAGRAYGTPYYISPEQIRGEVDIDLRADIYSLGATLYHMVTGKVPFDGQTPAAVMHRHLKDSLVPPDHINMQLSAGVGEVVEVMMAKDRSHRYASASDLLVDLEAIAAGKPPPQARRQINAGLLSGLASDTDEISQADLAAVGMDTSETAALSYAPPAAGPAAGPDRAADKWIIYAVVLVAALVLSVLLNIIQLFMR